jgi:hypothetical protein
MPTRIVSLLVLSSVLGSFLAACGGGGGSSATANTTGAAAAPASSSGAASAPLAASLPSSPAAIPQSSTPNIQPVAVAAAPGLTRNILTTSVTVCEPVST